MRRGLASALACLVVGMLASGCVGPDGKRAEELLQQATLAQEHVSSESFVLRAAVDVDGRSVTIEMDGGGYVRGARAGDFYMTMSGSGSGLPELGTLDMAMSETDGVMTVRAAGRTVRMSAPAAEKEYGSPADLLELARYVKSVSVEDGTLDGRPADRIVGTLDTHAMLDSAGAFLGKLLDSGGVDLGDVRVVLVVPRDTHLVEVMLADLDVGADGHKAHVSLSLAVRGVNEPVSIPRL